MSHVTAAVAAEHLGTTPATIRAWAKNGIIPGIKPNGRWRFNLQEVDAFLKNPIDPWAQSAQSRGRRRAS